MTHGAHPKGQQSEAEQVTRKWLKEPLTGQCAQGRKQEQAQTTVGSQTGAQGGSRDREEEEQKAGHLVVVRIAVTVPAGHEDQDNDVSQRGTDHSADNAQETSPQDTRSQGGQNTRNGDEEQALPRLGQGERTGEFEQSFHAWPFVGGSADPFSG